MRLGQPSQTAQRVAAYRLESPRVPAPYGDPAADEKLARDVAESAGGPGGGPMRKYLEARTRFFDWVVVGAVEGGTTQIVVGAAGYDGRSLRYAKPGMAWFEVDHPATQADKRARLRALAIPAGHVHFVPADFDVDPVGTRLVEAGLDTQRATLFALEGVAVYLHQSTLELVLRDFRQVAGPGSHLAISLSVGGGSVARALRRRVFAARVASVGEPARTSIPPDQVDSFLKGTGWQPVAVGDGRARRAGLVMAEPA